MFRRLPPFGGDQRATAEVVNNIMDGKTNNTGTVSLATGGATSTTLTDARIGADSVITLVPLSMTSSAAYFPYGAFQDSTTQTIASTTTAYSMGLNTTDMALGVSLVSGSRITVGYSGLYNLQFSAQLENQDNAQHNVSIWFSKNGTNIAKSNSEFTVPARKSSSIYGNVIAALNFYTELAKDDYVEIKWSANSTLIAMPNVAAQTSPTRPATPSVIATIQYLSPNSFTTNLFAGAYVSAQTSGSAIITHPANTVSGVTYKYIIVG
jgi:hypothetical protein